MGVTASVVGITAGVNSLTGGSITNALGFGPSGSAAGGGNYGTAGGTQQAADPFSPYRGGIAALYDQALTTPNMDPTKMPGYSAFKSGVMDPALEASKRTAAASGMQYSGGEQLALQKTAQQGYYGFMTDYMNRLAQGSGATNNPAAAASLGAGAYSANQAGVMQGLGGIATGIAGLSSMSGNTSNTYTSPYGASGYGVTADYSITSPSGYTPTNYTSGADYGYSTGSSYGLSTGGSGLGLTGSW